MVQNDKRLIRVAFAFPEDERWMGGVNYLYNLLFALDAVNNNGLEPVVFVGDQVADSILDRFKALASIKRSPLFNRSSLAWKVRRTIDRLTGEDLLVRNLFVKCGIDVASHCNLTGSALPFKTINWIPDFQHLHLPNFFSKREVVLRNRKYSQLIKESDCMVLSSYAAFEDMHKFLPDHQGKTSILHFVSQANPDIYSIENPQDVRMKYGLPQKFFYLPNQFWEHKNHEVVINALQYLKQRGADIHVVCTGTTTDLKNPAYFKDLSARIKSCHLEKNILILGLIDYRDVMALFRHCLSVINPSLFEGWSSTVEEAKSVGKSIILSDIPVHKEQAPPGGRYFNPRDPDALAEIMLKRWQEYDGGPETELESLARVKLPERTRKFGEAYQKIVLDVFSNGKLR